MKVSRIDLGNKLEIVQASNNKFADLRLHNFNHGKGNRIALVTYSERGSMPLSTEYMSYGEMNAFMDGILFNQKTF